MKLIRPIEALATLVALLWLAPNAVAQTTLNLQVSSGTDNADQDASNGQMWVDDNWASIGSGYYAGWRFQNVTIPVGATVASATLELRSWGSGTTSFTTVIRAQAADSASAFSTSSYNISNRTRTTAQVSWATSSTSYSDGQIMTSPSFASVVQEVIDRSGWASGNSLVIIAQGTAGSKGVYKRAGNTSYAAKLSVTYTTSGGGKTVLLVTQNPTIGSEESSRKSQFESWGYTVTTIEDSSSQALYDTALASADVVYVPYSAVGSAVSSKLRTVGIGVVYEAVSNLDYEFGLSNGGANGGSPNTTVDLTNTTHAITSGLSDPLAIYSASTYQRSINSPVSSSILLGNLNGTSNSSLAALEPGAALANTISSNNTASGRRVRLPFGGGSFTWSQITSGGRTLIQNALNWASVVSANKPLLLVIAGTSPTADESLRKSQFESWGYTVNTIDDSSSQATYDAALANAEVVYVPNTVAEASVSTKLRLAVCGVVNELERLDVEFGFATSYGGWSNGSTMEVFNNAHPVTRGFSTGSLAFLGNNARRSFVQGTPAPAAVGLAYLFTASSPDLMAIEEGGQLANTLVSNAYAAGRRVRLPLANGTFDWADLNTNGQTLIQQALNWASSHAGLVGHWKLDETSGTTAVDSSDSGIDGTYTNGPLLGVTGARGHAADFDGVNDHVTISGGSDFNITQSVTVSCWAKSNSPTWSGDGCLVSKRDQFYLHPNVGATTIYMGADVVGSGDKTASVNMGAIGSIQQWRHYVGVYDYENAEVRLYVDGVLRATTSVTSGTLLQSDTGALTIGWDDGITGTRYFDGQIDDVRLYDKALSEAEIAELYGLVGHWKFDDTSGTTATDSSELSNDITLWSGVALGAAGPYPGAGAIAAEFDGIDDNGGAPSIDAYDNITEYVSVATWVRFDTAIADQTQQNIIVSRSDWATKTGFNLLADQPYGDRLLFRVLDGATWGQAVWDEPEIEAGVWYHVVGTYDGATVRLYVDGQLKASTIFSSSIAPYTGNHISFGYQLDGRMHDTRVYNRAITEAEIAEIYGLVAHWKLDETSGSVAYDSSGMENHATLSGTEQWTPSGQVDGAHAFDYSDGEDYFTAPSNAVLDNLQEGSFSVLAYLKPSSSPPGTGSEYNSAYALLSKQGYHTGLVYDEYNQFYLEHWRATGPTWAGAGAWSTHAAGKFYHVVGVVNRDDGTTSIYVDGVLQETTNFTPGDSAWESGTNPWRIGISEPGTANWNRPAHGVIDDAKLYNRALSADEVYRIYESGKYGGLRIIKWVEVR